MMMVDLMNNTTGFEKEFSSVKLDPLDFLNIIKLLHNNKSLHTINLSRKNLNDSHAKLIADMLKTNDTLRRLELEGNLFGPEGCKSIADALRVNKTLRYLNLENNRLTDHGNDHSGIEELCTVLKLENRMLISLNLSSNCLTRKCGEFIYEAVANNSNLIHIDLSDNVKFVVETGGGKDAKTNDYRSMMEKSDGELNKAKFDNKYLFLPKIQQIRAQVEQNCELYNEIKIAEWNERKFMRIEDDGVRDVDMFEKKDTLEATLKVEDKNFINRYFNKEHANQVKKEINDFEGSVNAFAQATAERLAKRKPRKKIVKK